VKIQHVPLEWVNRVWPTVAPFFEKALEHSKDYDISHAQSFAASGRWALFVAVDDEGAVKGAGLVEFMNRPRQRVALVPLMGGRLIVGEEGFKQFKELLASFGATEIEAVVRESVARLYAPLGFEEKGRVVGVML
jgi:hypothetical protein